MEALVERSVSETRKDERKQTKAKYQNQETMDEKSDRKEWGRRRKRKRNAGTEEVAVRRIQG